MLKDPRLRRDVTVGVIVALVVLLLVNPLVHLAANLVIWAGEHVYEGLSRSIYKNAAEGVSGQFSFANMELILGVMSGGMVGVATTLIGFSFLGETREELFKKLGKLKRMMPLARYGVLAGAIVVLVFSIAMVGIGYAQLALNVSFEQRLTVLAPILSAQEMKNLRARWAMMDGRSDYVAITKTMNGLAEHRGVKLPAPLWQ